MASDVQECCSEYNIEATSSEETRVVEIQFCLPDDEKMNTRNPIDDEEMTQDTPERPESPFFGAADWLLSSPRKSDEESVTSVAYFEPTDFDSSYWSKALDVSTATTMGFAVVGLAVALTHPILFLAGLLGIATASASAHCWNGSVSEQSIVLKADVEEEATVEGTSSTSSAAEEGLDEEPQVGASTTLVTKVSQDALPSNWMEIHYPMLRRTILSDYEFVGLSVHDFFNVFFADDAPYSFQLFQAKRGDLDIKYGKWSNTHTPSHLSLTPPECAPDTWTHPSQTRILSFRAKTNNSMVGPPYADTRKEQRYICFSKRLAALEHRTTLSNIPFANCFCVVERWTMRATKDANGLYTTRLSIQADVKFSSYCPWEGAIRTKSGAALTDVVHAWCCMAGQALEMTARAKERRKDHADECAIEVRVSDYESHWTVEPADVTPMTSTPTRRGRLGGIRRSMSNMLSRRRSELTT